MLVSDHMLGNSRTSPAAKTIHGATRLIVSTADESFTLLPITCPDLNDGIVVHCFRLCPVPSEPLARAIRNHCSEFSYPSSSQGQGARVDESARFHRVSPDRRSATRRKARFRSQKTPMVSRRPTQRRLLMLYLVFPLNLGRWFTGYSPRRYPCNAMRVGRNRCIPAKRGRHSTHSRLNARVEQPTSRTVLPVTALRKVLATHEETFLVRLSCLRMR